MRNLVLSAAVLALWGCADNPITSPAVRYSSGPSVRFLVQPSAPWNLDRIDSRSLLYDGSYNYDRTGSGVHVYVIDSGIDSLNSDFSGRVLGGADFTGLGSVQDCDGHGTHVSGIVGGSYFGVAKSVWIHPVRIFGCAGDADEATAIAAFQWVVANAIRPAVILLASTAPYHQGVNDAVQQAVNAGISVVTSAGNDNADACNFSPGSVAGALTVAASTSGDRRDPGSNYGPCVDLFAPGNGVTSDWLDNSSYQMSGTSQAAAHVAGVVALYLENHPLASPQEVSDSIKAYSTRSVITASNSQNCNLVYTGQTVESGRVRRCPK